MKLGDMTLGDKQEVLGDLEEMVKSRGWGIYINESKENEHEHTEQLINSSDSEDEKLKGQIQGIRDEIELVDRLIGQLKESIKGGE